MALIFLGTVYLDLFSRQRKNQELGLIYFNKEERRAKEMLNLFV